MLPKCLCHNLAVLVHAIHELGIDPAFWSQTANRLAVQREYRELTYALYQTQNGSGKTFVVASWDADNQAYCGSF